MHNFTSSMDALKAYDGILLDAYGVFWGGGATGVLPGAAECMAQLVDMGKTVGILSNTTQLSTKEEIKFEKHGLIKEKHFHFVLTSGDICQKLFTDGVLPFASPRKTYALSGKEHPRYAPPEQLFEGSRFSQVMNYTEADFIYIHIPHINGGDVCDPEVFKALVEELVATKLPLICANPDHFAHEGNPAKMVVRQGSIAAMCEGLGGEVHYIGKPHARAFESALAKLGELGIKDKASIAMVGDTPETDIRGANAAGIQSVLVTGTGMCCERIAKNSEYLKQLKDDYRPSTFLERFSL